MRCFLTMGLLTAAFVAVYRISLANAQGCVHVTVQGAVPNGELEAWWTDCPEGHTHGHVSTAKFWGKLPIEKTFRLYYKGVVGLCWRKTRDDPTASCAGGCGPVKFEIFADDALVKCEVVEQTCTCNCVRNCRQYIP